MEKKIKYLLSGIKQQLLQKCSSYPNIDPRKLQVEIGNFKKGGCWCYVSEEHKPNLPYEAHYTIGIDSLGVGIVLNMETDKSVDRFLQNLVKRRSDFLNFVKALADKDEECELRIWERVAPLWYWKEVISFNINYIDNDITDQVLKILKNQRHSVVRFVCPKYNRGNEILYDKRIVDKIVKRIEQLQDLYGFART